MFSARSQAVSSKQPKLGLTQELSSRISESTTGYTFTPCGGSFTSPGIDTKCGVKEIACFETAVGGIEPLSRPALYHATSVQVDCVYMTVQLYDIQLCRINNENDRI